MEELDFNTISDQSISNLNRVDEKLDNRQSKDPVYPISPQATAYLNTIRSFSEIGAFKPISEDIGYSMNGGYLQSTVNQFTDKRPSFTQYDIPISDAYERLNSGEYYPKYENYIPHTNNEQRLAEQQSTGEVWGRGLTRFGTQILTSFFGSIAGIPVGISEWINTGNFEATYDNEFTRMLDDIDRRGQLNNNIYYTQADRDRSLLGGLGTSRFWADKALGGASFTVGMLLSEGLMAYATGGGSLTTAAGRISSRAAVRFGLTKANSIVASTAKNAAVGSRVLQESAKWRMVGEKSAKLLNDARFIITSSGYESGMEARHFRKDAEDQFYSYFDSLGIKPTTEQLSDFRNQLDNNSNKVLAANMGILSVSNMALFGRMFGVGNVFRGATKPIDQVINKSVFGIGTREVAPGVFETVKRKTYQKVLSKAWNGFIKPGFSEGVWEEGGQGTASTMMSEYMQSTYDPEISKEVSGYMDAFYNSLKHQFSDKEGQEEMLIGTIIGTMFGALGGSFVRDSKEAKAQQDIAKLETQVAQAPQHIIDALYTQENFLSQVGNANRLIKLNQSIEQDERSGNIVDTTLKSEAMLISALQSAHTVGKDGSFIEVLKGTIEGMDSTKIMQQFGLNSIAEAEAFKADKVTTLDNISKNYAKNRSIAEVYIGRGALPKELQGKEKFLVDALSFSLTMSQSAERVGLNSVRTIKEIFESVGNQVASETTDVIGMFAMSSPELTQEYQRLESDLTATQQQIRKKTDELKKLQSQPSAERSVEGLNKLEDELLQLQESLAVSTSLLNGVRETIENNYFNKLGSIGVAPTVDLTNLESALEQSKKAVESLEATNPEEYARLTAAFDALDKSVKYTKEFSDIYKGLLNPKFNSKIVKNIFGRQIASAKDLNDVTKQTLLRVMNTGGILMTEGQIGVSSNPLSWEVYNNFKQTGEVESDTLQTIASKLYTSTVLTKEEQEIYQANKQQVDDLMDSTRQNDVINKLRNNQPLNTEEETYYQGHKSEIDAILNDPLNNPGKTITTADTVPELSPEMQETVEEHEASRRELLESDEFDEDEVNTEYNQFYKDQVAKGTMTKEQALEGLERIGQADSIEYQQIAQTELRGRMVRARNLREQLREIISNSKLINKHFTLEQAEGLPAEPLTQDELNKYNQLLDKQAKSRSLTKAEQRRLQELEDMDTMTAEEIQQEEQLRDKAKRGGLTAKELTTLEELENKILQYNIIQGTMFGGSSLLDLLKLYSQTNTNIENSELNKTEHSEAEYYNIALADEASPQVVKAESDGSISQVTENGLVQFVAGGANISHVQLDVLLNKLLLFHPDTIIKINGVEVQPEQFSKHNAISGTVVEIQLEDGSTYSLSIESVKGRKNKRVGKPIHLASKTPSQDIYNLFGYNSLFVLGQKGSYYLLYETVDDTLIPVKSTEDFQIKNDSGLVYDPVEARKLQNGDVLELYYDETDSYNKTLNNKDLVSEANIYIIKNGKIVGRLKSTTGVSEGDLYEARKKVIMGGRSNVIVRTVLAGLPIIQTTIDNNKKLIPTNKSEVLDQGYYVDGEPNKDIPKGTSTRFIEAASKKNPTKRVPYIIMKDKVSGHKVAFPVEVTPIPTARLVQEFDEILADTDFSDAEKSLLLNDLLIKNNVDFESHWFTPDALSDSVYVNRARLALQDAVEIVDLDKFSNELFYDVSTVVDFDNNTFTPPKVILDLSSVEALPKSKTTPKPRQTTNKKPSDLTGAVVSYRIGKNPYKLTFKDDVDKALFMVSYPQRGANHDSYIKYLTKTLNITESQAVKFGRLVRAQIYSNVEGSTNYSHSIPSTYKPILRTLNNQAEPALPKTDISSLIQVGTKVSFWMPGGTQTGVIGADGRVQKDSGGSVDATLVKELKPLDPNINDNLKNSADNKTNKC